MASIQKGKKVLHEAEMELQHLMTEAAKAGEYQSLPILAKWADQLAKITDPASEIRVASDQGMGPKPGKSSRPRRKSRGKLSSSGYPKFVRENDSLVKIGWSKREQAEYEHKASQEVVEAVVVSILRLGRDGQRFAMEEILPIEEIGGDQIPQYQCYLALGWLRSIQLVKRHGRLGYTIEKSIDLIDSVEDCWNRLANRSPATVGAPDE